MSLILEALRKSEAERRRAQAPDLLAEPYLALPPARRPLARGPWLALGVVGLVASAWLARALWLPAPTGQHVDNVVRAPATGGPAAATPPQSLAAPAPVVMPATPLSPPPRRPASVVSTSAPPAPAPPIPTPAASLPSASVASPAAATRVPAATAAPVSPAPLPVAVAPPTTVATAAVPQSLPVAAPGAPLTLADLGVAERKQLPPLKLSMHMWNDAPAQRFVILDGQRLHEGDRIGDAVVERITADGVILAWNGRRLRLPLR